MPRLKRSAKSKIAETYEHPEADVAMRPEVGTQAQFRKKKPPQKYRFDSSLSPLLEWDGQNPARELGEALIQRLGEAGFKLAELAKEEASPKRDKEVGKLQSEISQIRSKLKQISGPFLNWAGKAERLSLDVPTLPLFIHERLSTKAIIETLKGHKSDKQEDFFRELYNDPHHSVTDQVLKAYEYRDDWVTEGWDCNTVTHIIGLRPFMSQLLCEQVVGRGLRRANYDDFDERGRLSEETAKVFGVPFEVIPFNANKQVAPIPRPKRYHVYALPNRAHLEIKFPRIEGYTQAIRNRIAVDWHNVPKLTLQPNRIPPEVEVKGLNVNNRGRPSLSGPGKLDQVSLEKFRAQHRLQELVFDIASALTREYKTQAHCSVPARALFPQIRHVVERYLAERVEVEPPAHIKDLFLAPYYGWLIERLVENIRGDVSSGEAAEVPRYESTRGAGSTADVDFWTSRDVREVRRSHLNYVVADTLRWEQSAAYFIDSHPAVLSFVKNAGLGFAIPYLHNGQMHDFLPDFVIRFNGNGDRYLILETKGYDPVGEVKQAAAERWVSAVNADGRHSVWAFRMVKRPAEVRGVLDAVAKA